MDRDAMVEQNQHIGKHEQRQKQKNPAFLISHVT